MAEAGAASPCQVLSGAGGVGKTQIAAHLARRIWESQTVDLLLWATASSKDMLVSTYAEAALAVADPDAAHRFEGDAPEKAAAHFLAWAQNTDRRWLIVLDDVSDPANLSGLAGQLDLWPPSCPQGHTVVTTRRRDAALPGRRIDVGAFTPDEARAYLTDKLDAAHRQDNPEHITGLARDLGHLPLALAQAVTYLIDLHLDCADYRLRLADRTRTLGDLVPEEGALPDAHRTTIAATWSLSVDHADRLRPKGLARPMLHLASLLDPNGIPVAVLTSPAALSYLTEHRARDDSSDLTSSRTLVDPEDAFAALRCLHRLSLADHTPDAALPAVRVHSLIQRATREALPPDARDPLAVACADALVGAWPEIQRDAALAQVLRANADTLIAQAHSALWKTDAHPLLIQTGTSLSEAGLLAAALTYFRDLSTAAQHHLGLDHTDTFTIRRYLTDLQAMSGDMNGARATLSELLDAQLRVRGPDDPGTLATRSELARWQAHAGEPAAAVQAFEVLLTHSARVLGPDHPQSLVIRLNIANFTGEAGDAAAALAGCEELLADTVRIYGPHHHRTLAVRFHLAIWTGEAGDPGGAVTAFAELVGDYLQTFGPDYPYTLVMRRNFAVWQREAGDPAGAVATLEELLPDQLRVLGPDHPWVLNAQTKLAHWQEEDRDPPHTPERGLEREELDGS
ncbi:tetratricopeptide repeat protein [Streptomyces sp. NBC_01381]|uniref:tetratricopeptide repeat protein n=1 Tax=Streptomyces sp. NBC_01381 TaxID=2903845 RepID=UPI002255A77F|nr:tetratricopeptide repeat protein [Streptomyces sp. NBC_01381]MCX4673576.1 tetratricopeptide repeat protein [Streptomyces sp. NBC_01381]